jgi:hypothetical protein
MSLCLSPIAAYSFESTQDTTQSNCKIIKPEFYNIYKFVDPGYQHSLEMYYGVVCKRIIDGRWNVERGDSIIKSIVVRYGSCRGNRINKEFKEYLNDMDMPESLIIALNHYCQETYDPSSKSGIKMKVLLKQDEWLRNEFFCQLTNEVADPSDFWSKFLEPDLDCIYEFRKSTDRICQDLRNDKISYKEAVYRWEQAYLKYENSIDPELTKKTLQDLEKPIRELIELFSK